MNPFLIIILSLHYQINITIIFFDFKTIIFKTGNYHINGKQFSICFVKRILEKYISLRKYILTFCKDRIS